MGPLGVQEIVLIFVIALIVFGPKKLPELGRSIGKALGELKRASNDIKRSIEKEIDDTELKN
jgi:sec-independent protein translocase protein TatA